MTKTESKKLARADVQIIKDIDKSYRVQYYNQFKAFWITEQKGLTKQEAKLLAKECINTIAEKYHNYYHNI